MKKFTSIVLLASLFFLNSCKKEEKATTGTIKVQFNGTPSVSVGQKVNVYFAMDLYHLDQRIFEFSKVSNAPHQEIIISDVKPQIWYYSIIQSTQGAPYETKGTVTIEAGKTGIVDVNF